MDDTLARMGFSQRWNALFSEHEGEGVTCGRIVRADRGSVAVTTADATVRARASARLRDGALSGSELPAVGDWVALYTGPGADVAQIEAVLERTSALMRGRAGGSSDVQVLAANVDHVFVVHAADAANPRRIERELSLVWESGAIPVVVLTKADLVADPVAASAAILGVAPGVDVLVLSSVTGDGLSALSPYTSPGSTVALIGPSGAGKSTLLNALLGEERQATREVRASDGRGRHTTVTRELVPLPAGGVVIDTPGLRELAMTPAEAGIASAFPDIAELATGCRFGDCSHAGEPGCAVADAVAGGVLAPERLESFHKLASEAGYAASREDARLRRDRERTRKTIAKQVKGFYRDSDKRGRG